MPLIKVQTNVEEISKQSRESLLKGLSILLSQVLDKSEDYMMTGFSDFIQMNLNPTFAAEYASRGFEVAGFIWLQGWNDQFEDGFVEAYEDNLVDLVHDVRAGLELPQLPVFVVEGPTLDEPLRQARLAALARLDSESPGAQVLIETRDLVNIDVEGNFHFNFNASNYLEVGRRMAAAVLERR